MTRVIARTLARELSPDELDQVTGADGTRSTSYCNLNTPQQGPDDTAPDFVEPIVVGP